MSPPVDPTVEATAEDVAMLTRGMSQLEAGASYLALARRMPHPIQVADMLYQAVTSLDDAQRSFGKTVLLLRRRLGRTRENQRRVEAMLRDVKPLRDRTRSYREPPALRNRHK